MSSLVLRDLVSGLPEEQMAFKNSHPAFFRLLPELSVTVREVFGRTFQTTSPAERVIFFLGNICAENFAEIVLLGGNGNGVAALQLLRGMYERVVALGYIHGNPAAADEFLAYGDLLQGKFLRHARDLGHSLGLSPADEQRVETDYAAARTRFGDRRQWSSLDLRTMARAVRYEPAGITLDQLYVACYWEPTQYAHGTPLSVVFRLQPSVEKGATFDQVPRRDLAERAIRFAHLLLLINLHFQEVTFGLGIKPRLGKLESLAKGAWP